METTLNADQAHRPTVAEAQAVTRSFLAAALSDVERVDITKVAPVTSGDGDLGGGGRGVATQCHAQDARPRNRPARAGS